MFDPLHPPDEITCRVEVWPNDTFAAAVSDEWQSRLERNPTMRMLLPSGLTPQSVYRDLIRQRVSFTEATAILLDEFGGLTPDDPTRCVIVGVRYRGESGEDVVAGAAGGGNEVGYVDRVTFGQASDER